MIASLSYAVEALAVVVVAVLVALTVGAVWALLPLAVYLFVLSVALRLRADRAKAKE